MPKIVQFPNSLILKRIKAKVLDFKLRPKLEQPLDTRFNGTVTDPEEALRAHVVDVIPLSGVKDKETETAKVEKSIQGTLSKNHWSDFVHEDSF